MAEKRFTLKLHQAEPCFYELLDNGEPCHTFFGKWITFDSGAEGSFFCEEWNVLHEENQRLKTHSKQQYEIMRKCQKENQQIRQTLDDMIESERTELGRSVLKQFKGAIE